jgi:hypothetical protein
MWATRIKIESGAIFGHWEFVKDEGKIDKNGHALAVFRCLLCRKEFEREIFCVVRKKTKACKPCSALLRFKPLSLQTLRSKARHSRKNLSVPEKKEMHELYLKWYGTTSSRASVLRSSAARRAGKLGLPCTITKKWIEERLKRGVCEVTGTQFDFKSLGKGMRKFAPSLDRQNPKQGYTEENTRVVVWIYNLWKSNYSDTEVAEFARIVVDATRKTV